MQHDDRQKTSKKPHSNHMYKSPKLFLLIPYLETIELKGSKSTYCARALTVYPTVEDEKSNVSKKMINRRMISRTNIIATNFV